MKQRYHGNFLKLLVHLSSLHLKYQEENVVVGCFSFTPFVPEQIVTQVFSAKTKKSMTNDHVHRGHIYQILGQIRIPFFVSDFHKF